MPDRHREKPLSLRLGAERQEVEAAAARDGVPVRQWILRAIRERLRERNGKDGIMSITQDEGMAHAAAAYRAVHRLLEEATAALPGGTGFPQRGELESHAGQACFIAEEAEHAAAQAARQAGITPLPVAVLNTSIATEDGTYRLRTVSAEEARALIAGREILSAAGHEATAQALTAILGTDVPVNRIQFAQQPGQVALVFKLRGRLPEGQVLSLPELERLGFDLNVLERLS